MRRNKVKRVIPSEENDPPKIFSASSLFLKDWLREEVQKATQVITPSESINQEEQIPNVAERKPRLSRNRKKC
jgi:hypothetical protein